MAEQHKTTTKKASPSKPRTPKVVSKETSEEKLSKEIQTDIEKKLSSVVVSEINKTINYDYSKSDDDFKLINSLINEQTERYIYTVLEPRYHADGGKLAVTLTDTDVLNSTMNISKEVANSLSPNYIYFLSVKYLNGAQAVYKYLVDKVYQIVITYVIQRNDRSNREFKSSQDAKKLLEENGNK